MTTMKIGRAVVTGSGTFPIDMARYDECFPASENDSSIADDGYDTRSFVVAKHYVGRAPLWTPRRWASFGWSLNDDPAAVDALRLKIATGP